MSGAISVLAWQRRTRARTTEYGPVFSLSLALSLSFALVTPPIQSWILRIPGLMRLTRCSRYLGRSGVAIIDRGRPTANLIVNVVMRARGVRAEESYSLNQDGNNRPKCRNSEFRRQNVSAKTAILPCRNLVEHCLSASDLE